MCPKGHVCESISSRAVLRQALNHSVPLASGLLGLTPLFFLMANLSPGAFAPPQGGADRFAIRTGERIPIDRTPDHSTSRADRKRSLDLGGIPGPPTLGGMYYHAS